MLIKLMPVEGSRPPELLLHGNRVERKGKSGLRHAEVRVQSSLLRTCQTMRWLRSALARKGCSFMGGSSPSSVSPSSSPVHRDIALVCRPAAGITMMFLSVTCSKLTHPKVDVAFSSAHHQHGLGSFLSCGICCLVTCCFSSTGRRWSCVT